MNEIKANLIKIVTKDNVNLLKFKVGDDIINVLILQMNIKVDIDDEVVLSIKPTKLYLSKNRCDFENVLKVKIININYGEIVAVVEVEFEGNKIEVVMLKEKINFDDEAYLMFKSTDVIIKAVND
jgi:molybdopterin-binding protein